MATLLAIYAHPDDEAFGAAGTLCQTVAAGHELYLICATRGESGKITDPAIDPASDLGALRQAELEQSCHLMGAHPPIFLDYIDSGRFERRQDANPQALMNADEAELERRLLEHIAQIKPDVILGFDPHGIYGHIDHIIMHRAVTAAFWSAGGVMQPAPQRLFYNAISTETLAKQQQARANSPLSSIDAAIYGVSQDSLALVNRVTGAFFRQKLEVIKAHRSQVGVHSSFAGILEDNSPWQAMLEQETFTLGGLRGSFPNMPVTDFFAEMENSS